MKHSSTPPPAMSTYRVRVAEVQALDCGDGRHVLLTEPPRYMPSAEFEAAFEQVPVHRNGGRPKVAKRAKGSKRPPVARRAKASAGGDEDAKKADAQRLFEKEGVKLAEIARRLKIPYSRLYYWSKEWKAPSRAKAAEPKGDETWME